MLIGKFSKESADTSRFTIDATPWIDADETIVGYTPPVITPIISPFPGPFPYGPLPSPPPNAPPPVDATPLVILSQFNLGTSLEFFVDAGTLNLAYQFQTSITGTSGRVKTVEVFVNIVGAPGVPYQ
jgi:hypothetical protein